ncbi:MAG: rhodanese-like domain-containing protein [Thiogranum sp.]|nr:rhodanese-like domain-containing protein [Thiogranum sp.]
MSRRLCNPPPPLWLLAGLLLTACGDDDRLSQQQVHSFQQVAQIVARQDDRVPVDDLARWIIEGRKDYVLVDVRPAADYEKGHIEGAQNLLLTELVTPEKLEGLPTDRKLIVYSQGSEVAGQAVVLLRLAGYDASLLLGGYNFWAQHVLNPDISPTRADGEYPAVPEQQAIACYFVGGDKTAQAPRKPVVPAFVPPVSPPAATLPPPSHEGC